jgi:hypothetical protein
MSHSSYVRRKALRSAAICLASVVLPAPGQPAGKDQSDFAHSDSHSHAAPRSRTHVAPLNEERRRLAVPPGRTDRRTGASPIAASRGRGTAAPCRRPCCSLTTRAVASVSECGGAQARASNGEQWASPAPTAHPVFTALVPSKSQREGPHRGVVRGREGLGKGCQGSGQQWPRLTLRRWPATLN